MISKAMIKFHSKFQFQILWQFYRTAEEVTKIKIMMLMVKSDDKYHHLFNLPTFWLLFYFFGIEIQVY